MNKVVGLAGLLGLLANVAGCGLGKTKCDLDMKKMQDGTSTAPDFGSASGAGTGTTPQLGYREHRYQGMKYFVQNGASEGSDQASHSGVVRLQNDCMFVGDALVIWHRTAKQFVPDLLAELKAGNPAQLSLGGGGRSLAEDGDVFPSALQEQCGATEIWYSNGSLQRPYSGCDGKRCGDPCKPCRSDDSDCIANEEQHWCNPAGRCVGFLTDQECELAKPCVGLDAATCAATEGCEPVQGRRLDNSKQCQVPETLAGCTSGDCGDTEIALAKTPTGEIWVFSSSCYPDGWSEDVQAPAGWDKWPLCAG